MTSDMAFECLLVSRDPSLMCTVNKILQNLSISTNICLSASRAFDQLSEGSTDLIVIDLEEENLDLLHRIQESRRWQKPTVVAVSAAHDGIPSAHILVRKPVTEASVDKGLKAAYSRMLYDYRRHARYALVSSVQATVQTSGLRNQTVDITLTDIGDGGLGMTSKEEFDIGDVLFFHLLLPGTERAIYIEARVQWARNYGALGCEYVRIPPVDVNILHDWLKSKAQFKKPLVEI